MPKHAFFVTGTDTEVGKTFITEALLHAYKSKGISTAAFKPVAAGCELTPYGPRNEDALLLQAASTVPCEYSEVNPIALEAAIAPHIAAKHAGQLIDLNVITRAFTQLQGKNPEVLLVEGAGGWRLPLGINKSGQQQFLSDFVVSQQLPVIIVVGMRLGCLNHALLTALAVRAEGLRIAGWLANQLAPSMPYLEDNIASLHELMDAPCLGSLPQCASAKEASAYLNLDLLNI